MSCQLAPITCCTCSCDPSVIVNLGAAGGVGGGMGGDEDPNDAGIVPIDTAAWVSYSQTIPGTQAIWQEWTWNPGYQTWVAVPV